MTVTIVGDITSGPLGPGYELCIHTDIIGPIAIDDVASAVLNIGGTSSTLVSGSVQAFASRTRCITIGLGPVEFGGFIPAPISVGGAIDVIATWAHANGTPFDTHTFTGLFTWEPLDGVYALVLQVYGDAGKGAVLQAVEHTYQNAP